MSTSLYISLLELIKGSIYDEHPTRHIYAIFPAPEPYRGCTPHRLVVIARWNAVMDVSGNAFRAFQTDPRKRALLVKSSPFAVA